MSHNGPFTVHLNEYGLDRHTYTRAVRRLAPQVTLININALRNANIEAVLTATGIHHRTPPVISTDFNQVVIFDKNNKPTHLINYGEATPIPYDSSLILHADHQTFFIAPVTFWSSLTAAPYLREVDPATGKPQPDSGLLGSRIDDIHMPVFDIDNVRAAITPSSTPGNSHLIFNKQVSWDEYKALLEAMADAELCDPNWAKACIDQGQGLVRAPWVRKPAESSAPTELDPSN